MSVDQTQVPVKPLSSRKLFEIEYIKNQPEYANISALEQDKQLLQAYRDLDDSAKQVFEKKAAEDAQRYEKELQEFKAANKDNMEMLSKLSPVREEAAELSPPKSDKPSAKKSVTKSHSKKSAKSPVKNQKDLSNQPEKTPGEEIVKTPEPVSETSPINGTVNLQNSTDEETKAKQPSGTKVSRKSSVSPSRVDKTPLNKENDASLNSNSKVSKKNTASKSVANSNSKSSRGRSTSKGAKKKAN